MVIHDESELPCEVAVIKTPLFESKSYIIPNKHYEDDKIMNKRECSMEKNQKKLQKLTENELDEKVRNSKKKSKKRDLALENYDSTSSSNSISAEDLEELKSVYKKCKAVIKKIESKYGHLLDFNEPIPCKKSRQISTDSEVTECQCTMNTKIVFDDEGNEIIVETVPADHICTKREKFLQSQIVEPNNDLQIEYHNQAAELPDSICELKSILQNPELEITYRNQVVEKLRNIKQEYFYEIKFNKPSIIAKLKVDVDDMIDFKGANLSTLPGYIY